MLEELGIFDVPLLNEVVDLGSASAPKKLRTLKLELCLQNRREYHPSLKSIKEQIERRLLANRAS